MFRNLTKSYFFKIILSCTLLVCGITASLLFLCHRLVRQQEVSNYLANYDIAVSNQSSAFSARLIAFSDFFFPLINSSDSYDALCELYLSPNGRIPAEANEKLLNTLYSLCSSDNYCNGLLLLTRTGCLYQYDTRFAALIPLELTQTTFRFDPYTLQILSDSQIHSLSNEIEQLSDHMYGLCGTVFQQDNSGVNNLGYIIALYSTEEFSSLLSSSGLEDTATFTLMDEEHNILFSSDNNYTDSSMLYLPQQNMPSGTLQQISLGEERYYVSSLYQSRYHYYATCQIPESSISYSVIHYLVLLFGIVISLLCILLYTFALRSSNRKVQHVKKGMELFGHSNLSYRMPVPDNDDEFASIIRSFNRMCDELQRNVERTYLFEISQRKAELYAMQTSINPHFLYNALEQIRVQILQGKQHNASQMLLLLSKMYRYQTKSNLIITIGEECAQMENMINLYSYRTGGCDYEIELDNSLRKYGIPKNILQPLIENSFIHGFTDDSDDNMIMLTITLVESEGRDYIRFCLTDNGSTATAETIAAVREKLNQPIMDQNDTNGFALSNVNNRLRLFFSDCSFLQPYLCEDGGFGIVFLVPPMLPDEISAILK